MRLGNVLFTGTQQKVLGLLYGKPDQSFYANEIVRWTQAGKGAVMRELERLRQAGILTVSRRGNQTHYQANSACLIYAELLGIVRKTIGIAEPIRQALLPLGGQIVWAFIYGSMAKGDAHAGSDIDLMLIGESLRYADVMELLLPLERQLGRLFNPTLYTPQDLRAKLATGNSFVERVLQQSKISIMGHNPLELMDDRRQF